jgi:hypothetical protein
VGIVCPFLTEVAVQGRQGSVPTLPVLERICPGRKSLMDQLKVRAGRDASQSERDERLLDLAIPSVRHHQQSWRNEIDDPAVQDGDLSLWMHHPTALTADAKVDLGNGRTHIHRSPPAQQLIGICERAKDSFDVGLERTLQPDDVPTIAHYCSSDR